MIISFDIGTKNLAYCIFDENKRLIDWKLLSLQSKHELDTIDEIYMLFDEIIKYDITQCIIEKQLSSNRKMLITANTIAAYYVFQCVDVKYISPKKKTDGKKLTYHQRKKYTIGKCHMLLHNYTNDQVLIDYYNEAKKKDDLADCFIQLVNYIQP